MREISYGGIQANSISCLHVFQRTMVRSAGAYQSTLYYTPLGLLALEVLVELREQDENFHVYAVRSIYFGKRKTYRPIPEAPVELAFLATRADYSYHDPLDEMLTEVLPCAWMQCSEQGIWFAKDKIPSYLLETWRTHS